MNLIKLEEEKKQKMIQMIQIQKLKNQKKKSKDINIVQKLLFKQV